MILYRFDRQPLEGFSGQNRFNSDELIELISLEGKLQQYIYSEVKAVCFTAESGPATLFSEHSIYNRRPKLPGLWTRFYFRDGDVLDGLLSHNLVEWPEAGFSITPPRPGSLRQRVFIPRAAILGTELRGIIGKSAPTATSRSSAKNKATEEQLAMFDPGETERIELGSLPDS